MSSSQRTTPSTIPSTTEGGNSDTFIHNKDIYCGRDRYSHSHPGNRHFRQLINAYRERYQNARHREDKTKINTEIVEKVKANGGRFMKLDDATGCWQELDPAAAHEKVSHALRSAKDPNRPRPKRKRQVAVKPPSDEEEKAFQILAADQQAIFLRLQTDSNNQSPRDTDAVLFM